MKLPPDYQPEFESIKDRLLEIAQIHSVDTLLKRVVNGVLKRPHVALAQIWLVDKCDRHGSCVMRSEVRQPKNLFASGCQRRACPP